MSGAPRENLLCAVLDALAEPEFSYIGLGYDKTVAINAGGWNLVQAVGSVFYLNDVFL